MGSNEKPVHLKVYVDKRNKRVMFAEAEEDFVEILFSFFTLPLGTIGRLSSRHADLKVGSLTSLYESVVNLNVKHFTNKFCKNALVNPWNSSSSVLQKLKLNLENTNSFDSSHGDAVFVQNKSSFIITDDLNVLPALCNTSTVLLNSLGLQNSDLLEERTMCFGLEELDATYLRVTEFLPIYDLNTSTGCFLKEQATFIVSDDLKVTIPPSTSAISMFITNGILDMEVVEVNIGEQEALLMLKASLTSTSVLTDCLYAFTKKP